MTPLQSLYNQKIEYNAIQDFLYKHLEALAIDKVFKKEDIQGLYEAKITLQNAFKQIEREYGHKEQKKVIDHSE